MKLTTVAVCALSLASCNRGEYATLPQSSSYHGVSRVATPGPAKKLPIVAAVPNAPALAPAAATVLAVPVAAVTPPVASSVKPAVAAMPVPSPEAPATTVGPPVTPRKLNLVQRLALTKVTRKLDKKLARITRNQHQNAASTTRLDQGLRTALIVLLVGVIVAAFSGVAGIFGIVGGIIVIIGLVLLLLYLLDQV